MAYAIFDTAAIHEIPASKELAQAGNETVPSLVIAKARLPQVLAAAPTNKTDHPGEQLLALGVPEDPIYIDRGFSGTTRRKRSGWTRPSRRCGAGIVFTVTKFDRFARNMA